MVELDFADHGWDYRDFYREGGGESRLTLRRLLLLVDGLDRSNSRFWCEVTDSDRFSVTDLILMTIYKLFTDEVHPFLTRREEEKKQKAFEKKKKEVLAAEKARKKKLGLI